VGKYDDKGFLGPNRNRRNERAPHLTGVLNFSEKTLDRLIELMEGKEDIKVQLSAWRSDDDPKKFSLKIDEPYEGGSSAKKKPTRRRDDDEDDDRPRARAKKRYDDDEEEERPRRTTKRRDDDEEDPW
jgi:hypothetical protein